MSGFGIQVLYIYMRTKKFGCRVELSLIKVFRFLFGVSQTKFWKSVGWLQDGQITSLSLACQTTYRDGFLRFGSDLTTSRAWQGVRGRHYADTYATCRGWCMNIMTELSHAYTTRTMQLTDSSALSIHSHNKLGVLEVRGVHNAQKPHTLYLLPHLT